MARKPLIIAALALCGLLSSACGTATGEDPDNDQKQINGERTDGYKNIVWLYMYWERGGLHHEGDQGTCSGTLIHGRVVLTAKHCVEDDEGVRASQIWVGFSDEIDIEFDDNDEAFGHAAEAVDIVRAPGEGIVSGNDMALLILDRHFDTPEPATIVRQRTGTPGEPFVGVGYGINDVETGADGVKLVGSTTLAWTDDKEIITTGGPNAACFGDSGGPLITEEGEVWGVLSRGREDTDPDLPECTNGDHYVRTDAWLDLIDAQVLRGQQITDGDLPLPTLAPPPELDSVPLPGAVETNSGTLEADTYDEYEFDVPADCMLELELVATSGDVDLYGEYGVAPEFEEGLAPCESTLSSGLDACAMPGNEEYLLHVSVLAVDDASYTLSSKIVPLE